VAALLRYPLPGVDDIEEDDVDIDELIEDEGDDDDDGQEESKTGGGAKPPKKTFDEEQLELLLKYAD
jgi:hypothetical protein